MKLLYFILCSLAVTEFCSAQVDSSSFTDAMLEQQELKMFKAISNNDSLYLEEIMAADFITVNADGSRENKETTLENLSKFKGSTHELSDKITHRYGNIGVIRGRAKFYFRSLLVADVWYTQVWQFTNAGWKYRSWQGTMTGWPARYPVIVTIVSILLLYGIFLFAFRNRKKKTF